MTLTGYYELDWLSAGVTSNNNQSNSYTLRQRQFWADALFNNGWDISAGRDGHSQLKPPRAKPAELKFFPQPSTRNIPPALCGLASTASAFRKTFGKKFFLGASAENAEMLNPAGQSLPTNYLFGSTGTGGGLYNLNANYSFNYAPDIIVKAVLEPGWGHWEIFGIQRTFRDRVYPNAPASATGAFNDKKIGAGIGGGFRAPLANKKVTVGLKGLWGQGVGRYGSSTIADVTLRPDGTLSPLHGFSALSTVELNPTPRLNIYLNYGADYINRDYVLNGATQVGYGTRSTNMSGCLTEPVPSSAGATGGAAIAPSNCGGSNKDVQEFTAGCWYNFYNGPKGRSARASSTHGLSATSGPVRVAQPIPAAAQREQTIWSGPRSATTCRKGKTTSAKPYQEKKG